MKFLRILGHKWNMVSTLNKFIILTLISEKNRYSKCLYKILNKIISFHMRKKNKDKS